MSIIISVLLQLNLVLIGYGLVVLCGVKSKVEAVGLSYLLGSTFVSILFLFCHSVLRLEISTTTFFICLFLSYLAVGIPLWLFGNKSPLLEIKSSQIKSFFKQFSKMELVIVAVLGLLLFYTFSSNVIYPITDWDAMAFYDFRAKVLIHTGSFTEGLRLGYFFQYPPYTTLLHTFSYLFNSDQVKIIYTCIYFSLLLTFFALLRRKQSNFIALLGTLLLATDTVIFRHATMAYTNLAYVAFLSLGFIYLASWLQSGQRKDLVVGALLSALSTWVRGVEPFWIIAVLTILLGLIRHKKDRVIGITLVLLSFGIYKYWSIFVASLSQASQSLNYGGSSYLNQLLQLHFNPNAILPHSKEVITYFVTNVLILLGYLVPAAVLACYYDIKARNTLNLLVILMIVVALGMTLVGTAILSLYFPTWNLIPDSLQRMCLFLVPLFIFVIFNSSIWINKSK